MESPVLIDVPRRFHGLTADFENPYFVAAIVGTLSAAQALSIVVLGTSTAHLAISACSHLLQNLIAIICIRIAIRRCQGIARLFWLLFAVAFLFWLVANIIWACDALSEQINVADSDLRLLYRLAGAPILMMLFLPRMDQPHRLKDEVFLDLAQVAIVVGLTYFTVFYLPVRTMSAADALHHNLRFSNLQNAFLLVATFVRMQFASQPSHRKLLLRLWLFILLYLIVNFFGNQVDLLRNATVSAWFGLCWNLPYVGGGLLALTWRPQKYSFTEKSEPPGFFGFLLTNLVLVTLLSCAHILADHWQVGNSGVVVHVALVASFVAFTLRLAFRQFRQQQEILQRKHAQNELMAANLTISGLLEDSRSQTQEISQINELGSLLQACTTREEAFQIIAEHLRKLFPLSSGCLSLLTASRNRGEAVAQWGPNFPTDHMFLPSECWCLRRGIVHCVPAGPSALRCARLLSPGPAICVPLIAKGEALGTLALQRNSSDPLDESEEFMDRRRQVVIAVAEHIALALSNLALRETLRLQAVRDPLTSLYNRRHMEEFLEREVSRARRKKRPVSVLMLDLDNFKRYNDTYGHFDGDKVLRVVGQTLLSGVRGEDVACRYGGEEFVVILVECTLQQAANRADQIRQRLKEYYHKRPGELRESVSTSVGVAAYPETTDKLNLLLQCADEALYQAKRAGRDRVVVASPAQDLVKQ